MKQADAKRIRLALERTRVNLKDDALELEKRRREIGAEREAAVAFLRLLCARYGDNDWDDDLPLVEIIREHLALPLDTRVHKLLERLAEAQQAARHVDDPQTVRSEARPSAAPERRALPSATPIEHDWRRVTERGLHRAVCTCTYRSSLYDNPTTADQAGRTHARQAATQTEPQEARRHA